jgi:hypothetical protein
MAPYWNNKSYNNKYLRSKIMVIILYPSYRHFPHDKVRPEMENGKKKQNQTHKHMLSHA